MDRPEKWAPSPPAERTTIRRCADGDANRILGLMREVFIVEMGWDRAFIVDAARVLKQMLSNRRPGRDLFLVSESSGMIIGVMFLLDIGAGTGFVRWLVVHKDFRGIGLGRALLDRALEFCRGNSFAKVRLVTVRDLSRAREFYLAAGFREVGRHPDILWRMPHSLCFMETEI